jgi:hypothetical protein
MANKKIKKVTTTVTEEFIEDFPSNEKTHIICILDRSGSMADIITDSIGGFNTFLKKQKELPDEATITVALFDDRYDLLYDNINIKKAEELTKNVWMPRGTTALYDAIGKTINAEKTNFAKLGKEKPAKVLVCIVTDGLENASKEYKLEDIKKLIKECEKDDWNFIYLAANQDAFAVGTGFGISYHNTYTYAATGQGVAFMSATLNDATVSYRGMSSNSADFKKKSKSLINQDDTKEDDVTNIGSITTDNSGNSYSTSNGNVNNVTYTSKK